MCPLLVERFFPSASLYFLTQSYYHDIKTDDDLILAAGDVHVLKKTFPMYTEEIVEAIILMLVQYEAAEKLLVLCATRLNSFII